MGGTCSTHACFVRKKLKGRHLLGDLGVDERTLSERMSRK